MKSQMRQLVLAAVFCTCASLLPQRANAALVYAQQPTYPGLFNGWTSSAATGTAANQQWSTYDDFTLTSSANIQKISWQGFYIGNSSNVPNTDNWELNVYGSQTVNGVAVPDLDSLKATASVAESDVSRTGQGFGTLTNGAQVLVYDFRAIVDNFFQASANTKYWLLIESLSTTNDPVWAWMSGNPGDGTSIQEQEGSTGFFQRSGDRAMALYDDNTVESPEPDLYTDPNPFGNLDLDGGGFASVPEPSSWILFSVMGAAVVFLPFVRRRRGQCAGH